MYPTSAAVLFLAQVHALPLNIPAVVRSQTSAARRSTRDTLGQQCADIQLQRHDLEAPSRDVGPINRGACPQNRDMLFFGAVIGIARGGEELRRNLQAERRDLRKLSQSVHDPPGVGTMRCTEQLRQDMKLDKNESAGQLRELRV